jgi:hypothetical protein
VGLGLVSGSIAAPPINDNFTNATVLTGHFNTFTGALAEATSEVGESAHPGFGPQGWPLGYRTVWWSWTAPDASPVAIYMTAVSQRVITVGGVALWSLQDLSDIYERTPLAALPFGEVTKLPYLAFVPIPGKTYQIQLIAQDGPTVGLALVATNSPFLVEQPKDQTASERASVLFKVLPVGIPPFSFQWRFDGNDLPGETTPMLALTNLSPGQAGTYSVMVSNVTGVTTSRLASLTIDQVETHPHLAAGGLSISNRLDFTLEGEAGRYYRIESSSNLLDWVPEKSFLLDDRPFTTPFLTSILFASSNSTHFLLNNDSGKKFLRGSRYLATNEVCNLTLKRLRFAKELWLRDPNPSWPAIETFATPMLSDLLPYFKEGTWPRCPSGGFYSANNVLHLPTCTTPGHVLEEPR